MLMLLILGQQASAKVLEKDLKDKAAIGVHGMALMNVDGKLVASHMPLHHPIHAFQLLLELEIESFTPDVGQSLITLMPEKFDLYELARGELKHFNAAIYDGHFERGGEKIHKKFLVRVKKVLLFEQIESSSKKFSYFEVNLDSRNLLVIKKIGDRPSFDQIFHLSGVSKKGKEKQDGNFFKLDSRATASLLAKRYALDVQFVKSIYLETQDFQ